MSAQPTQIDLSAIAELLAAGDALAAEVFGIAADAVQASGDARDGESLRELAYHYQFVRPAYPAALTGAPWIDAGRETPPNLQSVLGYVVAGGLVGASDEPMIEIVSYHPALEAWLQFMGEDGDAVVTVSHWMPLPAPPTHTTR
jgi:hypothetical protein